MDYRIDSPLIAEFQLTIWTTMKIINRLASYLSDKFLLGFRKISTELVIELRLLVKSMHKKVNKGTNSGCLDNQYR